MSRRQPQLKANAAVIMEKRYQWKDGKGGVTETPADAIFRVVSNVASVNGIYGSNKQPVERSIFDSYPMKTAKRQYDYLDLDGDAVRLDGELVDQKTAAYDEMVTNLDFLPNSPTWTGAGTPLGQLAACFVLPIDDDLGIGRSSIMETLKVATLIQQTGGGNGFSFGDLRPKGAIVKRSMGKASGPVGFMKSYDAAFGIIAQGGSRRGANMGVMPITHPDVMEFINAKVVEGEIENFNISVAITDDFMEAVAKDADWTFTHDGIEYGTVKARELFENITKSAWVIGDPGTLYIDAANRTNPVPARYVLKATNPCGEQWLGPYENCCLGSINLANFATWEGEFDWDRFAETVRLATDFLDDVVDANQYVPAVPELESAAQGGRRIGLGLMGLADAMAKLGVRYGSADGEDFASQVTEFARFHTMLRSTERAGERGPFGWIEDSIYDPEQMQWHGPGGSFLVPAEKTHTGQDMHVTLWSPPTPMVEHERNFGRPYLDWAIIVEGIKTYGIRNSCQFTFAPTGTISNVAGTEGSGCEPFFALAFDRFVTQEEKRFTLSYASDLFNEALVRAGLDEDEIKEISARVVANSGSCQGVEGVPDSIQYAFPVAADVTAEGHVRMQAVLQRFVDNSISKTINMPKSATVEDVQDAYMLAYELGCKGITIYRQGSREIEVLTTGAQKTPELDASAAEWPVIRPMSIPPYAEEDGIDARLFPVRTAFGKVQVLITEHKDFPGRPFDVRIQLGKTGADKNADIEALGRMLSTSLRAGVGVDYLVEQLIDIGGHTVSGFGPAKVKSVADAVAKLLRRRYLAEEVVEAPATSVPLTVAYTAPSAAPVADPSRVCPKCHNASLVMESGCAHCDIRLGGCGIYEGCE